MKHKGDKLVITSIRIEATLLEALRKHAQKKNTWTSELIRHFIIKGLAESDWNRNKEMPND